MSSQSQIEHRSWTSLQWDTSVDILLPSISIPSTDPICTVHCTFFDPEPRTGRDTTFPTQINLFIYAEDTIACLFERLSRLIRIPSSKFDLIRKNQYLTNKTKLLPQLNPNEQLIIIQTVHNDRKLFQKRQRQQLTNKKPIVRTWSEDSIKSNRQMYIDTFNIDEDQLINSNTISSSQWRRCLIERNDLETKQDNLIIEGDRHDFPLMEEIKKTVLKLFVEIFQDIDEEEWQFAPLIDGIYFSSGQFNWKDVDHLHRVNLIGRIYSPFLIGNSLDFIVSYHDHLLLQYQFRIDYDLNTIRTYRHQTSLIFKSKERQNKKKILVHIERNRCTLINKNDLDQIRHHLFGNNHPSKYTSMSDDQFFEILLAFMGIRTIHDHCFGPIVEMIKQKFAESQTPSAPILQLQNHPSMMIADEQMIKIKYDQVDDKENICTDE